MGRRCLPRGIAVLVFAASVLAAGTAPAQSLRSIALGRSASSRTPRLSQDDVDGLVKASNELRVILNAPYEIWSSDGSYLHAAVYQSDFSPAAGAVVYVDDRAVGITGPAGALTFRYQPPAPDPNVKAPSHYHVVTAILGRGTSGEARGRAGFETIPKRGLFEKERLVVYADKSAYAPGERVRMRAIAWKLGQSYEPVSGEPIHFQLRDNQRRVIATGAAASSTKGVADFTLPLPDKLTEGVFEVIAQHGEQRAKHAILIKKRATSLLHISHTLPDSLSAAQNEVSFRVKLRSVFGTPPARGQLRVRLRAGKASPFVQTVPVTGGRGYALSWSADVLRKVRESLRDGDLMYVDLAWRDDSGHTESVIHTLVYYTGNHQVVWGQASSFVSPGQMASLPLQLVTRSGEPVPAAALTVNAPSGVAPVTTDSRGRATLKVPVSRWPTKVVVQTTDGTQAERVLGVTQGALTANVGMGELREGRPFPLEIALGAGLQPVGKVAHVNVTNRTGAIVGAHLLEWRAQGDRFVASAAIPAPAWGTALITMFCPARRQGSQEAGLVVGGLEVEVSPSAELTISLNGAPKTVRPGQRVTFRGRITDARGTGRTAEVSATVTEATSAEAALWEPRLAESFYDGELAVSATTGERHLHWPVMSRTWGTARMDLVVPEEAAADRELRAFGRFYAGAGITGDVGSEPKLDTHARARLQARRGRRAHGPKVSSSPGVTPPRTSMWVTGTEARGGYFSFSFTVPEDPSFDTQQRLVIVASDDRGGIGVAEHRFEISRPVVVEHALPPSLALGRTANGRIAVLNDGDEPLTATVSLKAPKDLLSDGAPKEIQIAANDSAYVEFPLIGAGTKTATLEARVRGKALSSYHRATVEVTPTGTPVATHLQGQAMKGQPYEEQIGAAHRASVRVSVPYRGMVADTLDAVLHASTTPSSLGSRSTAAYYLALYLNGFDMLTEERALAIRDVVAQDLATILSELRLGKGIASGKTFSPYLTARAIQGLIAARETNFPVPDTALQDAGEALLRSVGKDGLLTGGDPVWWQGEGKERQLSLTAFTFRVLAEAGPEVVPLPHREAFKAMQASMRSVINLSSDPLTVAHAGMGLIAYSNNFLQVPLEMPVARRLLRRLREGRRNGYWEPSWFSSAAGSISTTAHALELASLIDPEGAALWLEEALPKLELARLALPAHSLGDAAASLMRLSAVLGIPAESQWTTLTVEVNGRRAKRLTVDPNKPIAAADAVRYVELSPYLRAEGENTVRVTYSGSLPVTATITSTRYEDTPPQSPWQISRRVGAPELASGDSTSVVLSLTSGKPLTNAIIEEPLPAAWHVTRDSLDRLVAQGKISDYELSDRLVLHVNRLRPKETIEYRVFAGVPSELVLPPPRVHPRGKPESAAIAGQPTSVTIR